MESAAYNAIHYMTMGDGLPPELQVLFTEYSDEIAAQRGVDPIEFRRLVQEEVRRSRDDPDWENVMVGDLMERIVAPVAQRALDFTSTRKQVAGWKPVSARVYEEG